MEKKTCVTVPRVSVLFLITIQKVVGTLNIILDFINNTYVIVSKYYLGTLNIILDFINFTYVIKFIYLNFSVKVQER